MILGNSILHVLKGEFNIPESPQKNPLLTGSSPGMPSKSISCREGSVCVCVFFFLVGRGEGGGLRLTFLAIHGSE